MSERARYLYDLPEGVKAALLRLRSACKRDGVDSIRVNYDDGDLHVFADDRRGNTHYLELYRREFYEIKEVG
jgi:hypothetical protein